MEDQSDEISDRDTMGGVKGQPPTDDTLADWAIVAKTLKEAQKALESGGARYTWLDAPIDIATQHAGATGNRFVLTEDDWRNIRLAIGYAVSDPNNKRGLRGQVCSDAVTAMQKLFGRDYLTSGFDAAAVNRRARLDSDIVAFEKRTKGAARNYLRQGAAK